MWPNGEWNFYKDHNLIISSPSIIYLQEACVLKKKFLHIHSLGRKEKNYSEQTNDSEFPVYQWFWSEWTFQ